MGKTPDRITADNVKNVVGGDLTKVRSKEELEFPYECAICKKRFKSVQGRNGHMTTHNIETIDVGGEEEIINIERENPTEWVTRYARKPITNQDTINILSKEEQVTFVIPEDPYDSRVNFVLGLNGQKFDYPVGEYVILPRSIVKQIKNIFKESELAKRRGLIERSKDVEQALS